MIYILITENTKPFGSISLGCALKVAWKFVHILNYVASKIRALCMSPSCAHAQEASNRALRGVASIDVKSRTNVQQCLTVLGNHLRRLYFLRPLLDSTRGERKCTVVRFLPLPRGIVSNRHSLRAWNGRRRLTFC